MRVGNFLTRCLNEPKIMIWVAILLIGLTGGVLMLQHQRTHNDLRAVEAALRDSIADRKVLHHEIDRVDAKTEEIGLNQ